MSVFVTSVAQGLGFSVVDVSFSCICFVDFNLVGLSCADLSFIDLTCCLAFVWWVSVLRISVSGTFAMWISTALISPSLSMRCVVDLSYFQTQRGGSQFCGSRLCIYVLLYFFVDGALVL